MLRSQSWPGTITDIQAVTVCAAANGTVSTRATPNTQAFGQPNSWGRRLLQRGTLQSFLFETVLLAVRAKRVRQPHLMHAIQLYQYLRPETCQQSWKCIALKGSTPEHTSAKQHCCEQAKGLQQPH